MAFSTTSLSLQEGPSIGKTRTFDTIWGGRNRFVHAEPTREKRAEMWQKVDKAVSIRIGRGGLIVVYVAVWTIAELC